MDNKIRQAIYDKYIAPTKTKRPDYIGVEVPNDFVKSKFNEGKRIRAVPL